MTRGCFTPDRSVRGLGPGAGVDRTLRVRAFIGDGFSAYLVGGRQSRGKHQRTSRVGNLDLGLGEGGIQRSKRRVPGIEVAEPALPHVPFEQLLAESHGLVLTASLNPSTQGAFDTTAFARARRGLVLVNVARGGLIVERDLAQALDDGTVAMAALDVRDPEPPDPADDALVGRPDVIQTPHAAGVSVEALAGLHRLAAEGIESLLRQGGRL